MHGLSLDGSGEIAETEVHPDNVAAFERAGWKSGAMESEDVSEEIPEGVGTFHALEEDEAPVVKRKKGRKK